MIYSRIYSRRFKSFVVMCSIAVLTGILMGVGVVALLNSPAPDRTSGVSTTATVTPIQAAVNTTDAPDDPSLAATPTPTPPPTATTTTAPTATASARPTALPTVPPTPHPTPDPAAAVALEQISAATAALRSGQLEAVTDHRDGGRSTEVLRFDLGDAQREPRLLRVTTIERPQGTTTTESLMVGDRAWQRQGDTTWTTVADQPTIQAQVQAFLPDVAPATDPEVATDNDTTVVQWYDPERDADVTVYLAAGDPVLRELRHVPRGDGAVLTVTYSGWNTYVDIIAPDGT